jgi:hypothetical protein
MKSHKLTLSAAALSIVILCAPVFAQNAPAPAGGDGPNASAGDINPRDGYRPLTDGAKKSAAEKAAASNAEPTSSVPYRTFTVGAGSTLFRWTVTTHGNIIGLQSPAGFEHLANGIPGEGYAVSMNTVIGVVRYFDAGFIEAAGCAGNVRSWSPVVFETGVSAAGTTLIRDTCDGAWRLTQTFSRNATNHEITVTMQLRNLTVFNYTGVRLDRYFDADLDGDAFDDTYARTLDSVGGQDGVLDNLALTAISFNVPHTTSIQSWSGWAPSVTNQVTLASPIGPGDFVGRVSYNLATINHGAFKTVKVLYKRQ